MSSQQVELFMNPSVRFIQTALTWNNILRGVRSEEGLLFNILTHSMLNRKALQF